MSFPILSIRKLNTVFHTPSGDVNALRDLSLEVERGEVLAIVGESGSGKSTLGFSILRLIDSPGEIVSGSITYHDKDGDVSILDLSLPKLREFRWVNISMIFQSAMNVLNPVARIERQFIDTFEAHNLGGDYQARIEKYLQIAGLGKQVKKMYPHELSGGMKQRVSIALALSCEPSVLIADEPTTALDVVVQKEILSSIIKIKEELNLTVMFITHDLSVASSIADRLAIFYAGRPVEVGSAEKLLKSPQHPYTAMLLSSMISLNTNRGAFLKTMGGTPPDLRKPIQGCSFMSRCPLAEPACGTYDLSPGKSYGEGYVECIHPGGMTREVEAME